KDPRRLRHTRDAAQGGSNAMTAGKALGARSLGAAALLFVALASTLASGQSAPRSAQPPADIYREVYSGWKWWHVYCYRCHGVDALGTTNAPNLSDPMEKFTRAEFLRIVRNGRPNTAMQGWSKLLDDSQIEQVRLYVRAR